MPTMTFSKEKLDINIVDLLVETNLVTSKSEARRLIEQNGISINQTKVNSINDLITKESLTENFIIIQKGKKIFLKVIFE
jgi:tyrosyl-tRNA synthetase